MKLDGLHLMIDLETLGTKSDAAIIQIGAVAFQAQSGGKLYSHKGFRQTVAADGGSVDVPTIAWWMGQGKAGAAMKQQLTTNSVPEAVAIHHLQLWLDQEHQTPWGNLAGVWAMPANFDIPILESAFHRNRVPVPWSHRATRCAKTLFELVGGWPKLETQVGIPHDALDDATNQAMAVQKALAMLP